MAINRENVRRLLQTFDFKTLFIEEMGGSLIPNARPTPTPIPSPNIIETVGIEIQRRVNANPILAVVLLVMFILLIVLIIRAIFWRPEEKIAVNPSVASGSGQMTDVDQPIGSGRSVMPVMTGEHGILRVLRPTADYGQGHLWAVPMSDSGRFQIGRAQNNDAIFTETRISSIHAVLEYRNGSFRIVRESARDQSLKVNDEDVATYKPLDPNQKHTIILASVVTLEFEYGKPAEKPEQPPTAIGQQPKVAPAEYMTIGDTEFERLSSEVRAWIDIKRVDGAPLTGRYFVTTTPFRVGRYNGTEGVTNNLVIPDGRIGANQFELVYDRGFKIVDMGRRNSTIVTPQHGTPIKLDRDKPLELRPGTPYIIRIGTVSKTELVFQHEDGSTIVDDVPPQQESSSIETTTPSDQTTTNKPVDLYATTAYDTPESAVAFTLYNPGYACKQTRYSLVIYAHTPDDQSGIMQDDQSGIKQDVRKFSDELGDAPKERHSAEPIPIAPKTEITIVPEAEGITFDPPELTKTWDDKWLRFNFNFEVSNEYPDEEVLLRISVQVKGFEVACIKSSCEVVADTVAAAAPALPDDPLVDPPRASGTRKADAHLYRNVFLSYSHKDEEIAWRRARQIEQALGDHVFMDVKDLRAGDDWETRLFEWIDQADIIHLLWSENSAQSDFCRREWTYALEKKCGDTRCFGVIRPVYWQKPMPTPPPELAHLHFQPIKVEDE